MPWRTGSDGLWWGPGILTLLLTSAPALGGDGSSDLGSDLMSDMVRVAGYLLVLIALAILAVKMGQRWQPSFGSSPIRLLGGRNLAPGIGLRLVQVGSRTWLIGITREQISLLAELPPEDVPHLGESQP